MMTLLHRSLRTREGPSCGPSGELQPWDLSAIVPIDSVRTMPAGMPVYLRTEFANGELADLEMRFVAVVEDFMPTMPGIMVEASDPGPDPARGDRAGHVRFPALLRGRGPGARSPTPSTSRTALPTTASPLRSSG